MNFYRLIKPDWAKPLLSNGDTNPKFVKEIEGPDTYEAVDYPPEFLAEKNAQGYNIYFFPNHPSKDIHADGTKWMAGRHIDVFNFVFVDMDLKDKVYADKQAFLSKIAEFPLKPSMTVDSGNGIHAYWRITDLTRDMYVITQLALINHFKTDPSIYTTLQLMRLPGYMNTKVPGAYIPAQIIPEYSSGADYTLANIPGELYQLPEATVLKAQNHINKLDGKLKIELSRDINIDEIPDRFLEYIEMPQNLPMYNMFNDPMKTHGDLSRADMSLANTLNKAGFNKKEALAVIANTKKALKHKNRMHYAEITVDKAYTDKLNAKFLTVGQRIRTQTTERERAAPVRATYYFDSSVLGNPWRKKEVNGLIAGPGVGKTSVALLWIRDSIQNNPDNDDISIFFSLEMPEADIIERWIKLVGTDSPLADRLYVIGNEEADGTPRNLGLQEMHDIALDIKKLTGKNLGMTIIDHIGLVARHIDINKKPNFGAMSEAEGGWGSMKTISLNTVATQMKTLAKILDTLLVPLTQTTKGKGAGDTPIGKDGAYGISQYENIMDRIITIWQPLCKVPTLTKTKFLAFQYVKIREKSEHDRIQTDEPKLLVYDLATGDLQIPTPDQFAEFNRLLPQALAAREREDKKQGGGNYSIHLDVGKINESLKSITNQTVGQTNEVAKVQPNQHN